ncbi:MAG: tetratricopeptide repeat protein [Candidatus Pacebacteria bacterium]|nr:tetratricopeptide repeat protein [Candidatus Paceibacterota bacterium]
MTKVLLALLVIVGGIVYFPNLRSAFYEDDIQVIVENPGIQQFTRTSVANLFLQPMTDGDSGTALLYRPLAMMTFAANVQLSEANTFTYHVVNNLLHICNALLLFFLVRTLMRGVNLDLPAAHFNILAGLSTILWLIHPLQSEAVSSISGRADLLAFLFIQIGMLLLLRGTVWQYRVGAGGAMVLALMSHESAILFPVYVVSALIATRAKDESLSSSVRAVARVTWPFVALALLYGLFRSTVLKLPSEFFGYTLSHAAAFFEYIRLVVVPTALHPERTIPLAASSAVWAGMALLVLFAALIVVAWRRGYRSIIVPAGFIALPLLLVFGFSAGSNARMLEHWMYVPLAGLSIVIGGMGGALYYIVRQKSRIAAMLLFVAVCAGIGVYGVMAFRQNKLWSQSEQLLLRIAHFEPQNVSSRIALAIYYAQEESFDLVEQYLLDAALLDPFDANIPMMLGNLKRNTGAYPKAIEYYEQAIALNPELGFPYRNLAGIYIQQGDKVKALPLLLKLEEIDPSDVAAHFAVAQLYFTAGKKSEALKALERGIPYLQSPDAAAAYEQLLRKLQ